jgi:hypothetical protein
VHLETSREEHVASWKRINERTSASPFGPTFSQLKVESLDPEIAEFNASMASFPVCTGYSPEAYQDGMNAMLVKNAGDYRAH